jgi:chitin synthase
MVPFQAKIQAELKELRNKSVFFFSVFNALFVLIVFMLTLHKVSVSLNFFIRHLSCNKIS